MFPELMKDVFQPNQLPTPAERVGRNLLISLEHEQIQNAETRLKFSIPSELKKFYYEVGFGFIDLKPGANEEERSSAINLIVDPNRLADLYLKEDPDWMADEDLVDDNELPFFDIGDQLFLVLRPFSDNPNAVFWPFGKIPISDSFFDFIKLLISDPEFHRKISFQ